MRTLSIDIETYSSEDLTKTGVYRYCDAPDFTILLFAYAFDNEEVKVIDLAQGEELPEDVIIALTDKNIIKTAFNANFEMVCLTEYLGAYMDPRQWRCTMIKAMTLGLPSSLSKVGEVLGLEDDKQKLNTGKALIRYFSIPCKPTKTNNGRTRNLPHHDIDKWNLYKEYNKRDVEAEIEINKKLSRYTTTNKEQDLWTVDQEINNRGVGVDLQLIDNAIDIDNRYTQMLTEEAIQLTGLSNPNSTSQLKEWINDRSDYKVTSLTKDTIPKIIEKTHELNVIRVLELRQLMSKTSTKKYEAMKTSYCKDSRVRGLLQFYGANRTGRWAGRLVQVQNLPQNHLEDLELARQLVKDGDLETIEMMFDSVPDTLSQLIRTAFIPSDNSRFIVADFSAIEARVIAWLAGEQWRLDVFRTHGKIYEASASQMFKVPLDSIKKGSDLRQKGKIAELALGYGGGVGAIKSMDKKGSIPENELSDLVSSWREANTNITKFWWDCDKAAKKAISNRTTVKLHHGIEFIYDAGILFIQLPSGRRLSYIKPKLEEGKFGEEITFEGIDQTKKQWTRINTYGPKIVENIVQAVARDCLAEAMFNVNNEGYKIVMHVHDEIIVDAHNEFGSVEHLSDVMCRPIIWAEGLPLRADGYECNYYMKD